METLHKRSVWNQEHMWLRYPNTPIVMMSTSAPPVGHWEATFRASQLNSVLTVYKLQIIPVVTHRSRLKIVAQSRKQSNFYSILFSVVRV